MCCSLLCSGPSTYGFIALGEILKGGYVLEAGDYAISIRSDFTTAINQFNSAGDVTYLSRANGFANYTAPPAAAMFASPARRYMETLDFFVQDYLCCVIAWMPKNSIFRRQHRTERDAGGLVAKASK